MFKNYSSEQFQRLVSFISLLTSIPVANINTTIATILALVGAIMQVWGYIQRWRKGDVTIFGARR